MQIEFKTTISLEIDNPNISLNGIDIAFSRYMIPHIEWEIEKAIRDKNISTESHAKISELAVKNASERAVEHL
jgi:type III secretory pathway component EscR